MKQGKVLFLAGPTASGKSQLALALAKSIGGEIICCDALQIYKHWRILTTRPSLEEEQAVCHHLYGFVEKGQAFFSVEQWRRHAHEAVKTIFSKGKTPIFVGGTGLYFRCFLEGLSPFPYVPQSLVIEMREHLEKQGSHALHAELMKCDNAMAQKLSPQDGRRICRALEIYQASNIPMSLWQKKPSKNAFKGDYVALFLQASRNDMRLLVEKRFHRMIQEGLMEEVANVASFHLNPHHPLLKAHGARPLMAYIMGKISFEEARRTTIMNTLQYVKRQNTWARRYMHAWHHLPYHTSVDSAVHLLKRLLS